MIICCHSQESCHLAVESLSGKRMILNLIFLSFSHECHNDDDLLLGQYPNAQLQSFPLNLSSFYSIQTCAQQILEVNSLIHFLINNAGRLDGNLQLTGDGFERVWQVNHLGPAYFTKLLMPALIMG